MQEQIEHYLKPKEIERIKKIALLFSKHTVSIITTVRVIKAKAGKIFDPKAVEAFLELHPEFEKISQKILDD